MKSKLIILFFLVTTKTLVLFGQKSETSQKYIEVEGSADMLVQPDELDLEIEVVEIDNNSLKIDLHKIEQKFDSILILNSIDRTEKNLVGLETHKWYYWWRNRNKTYKSKTYKIKVQTQTNFLKLISDLNQKWVENIRIVNKTNKNLHEYRKQVKIEALKMAKEKATYLLASVNQNLGEVIFIEELNTQGNFWSGRNNDMLSNSSLNSGSSDEDVNNTEQIKLKYEVKVRFKIK
jgi:uncharacterized protein YggE